MDRGFVADADLLDLYRSASAVVFPSLFEGFGLPLVEALAVGARVVATRLPVFEELAGDSVQYVADPLSVRAWRDALKTSGTARMSWLHLRMTLVSFRGRGLLWSYWRSSFRRERHIRRKRRSWTTRSARPAHPRSSPRSQIEHIGSAHDDLSWAPLVPLEYVNSTWPHHGGLSWPHLLGCGRGGSWWCRSR